MGPESVKQVGDPNRLVKCEFQIHVAFAGNKQSAEQMDRDAGYDGELEIESRSVDCSENQVVNHLHQEIRQHQCTYELGVIAEETPPGVRLDLGITSQHRFSVSRQNQRWHPGIPRCQRFFCPADMDSPHYSI